MKLREKKKEMDQKRKMEELTVKRNKNCLGSNEIETLGIQREYENKIRIKRKIKMKSVYKEKKPNELENAPGITRWNWYQTGKN